MDNEAFRALIHKGKDENETKKTTKEIAREYVEKEYELKKKRNKRKTTDYSSSDNEDKKKESPTKYIYRHGKKIIKRDDGTYRDRAKERRKGLNIDYKDTSDLIHFASEDKNMSKFLGGDEKHTHLVKGLDLALADKVRRDQKNLLSTRDDMDHTTPSIDFQNLSIQEFITKMNSIKSQSSNHAQTILTYILSKLKHQMKDLQSNPITHQNRTYAIPISVAGYQIQKSTTTFSFQSNVLDASNAWEIPREYTVSKALQTSNSLSKSNISTDTFVGFTSFDSKFLHMIHTSFDQYYNAQTKQPQKKQKDKSIPKQIKGNILNENKKDEKDEEEEEDEDIFSGIGNYVPTISSKKKEKDNTSIQKSSIFDGLITKDVQAPKPNPTPISFSNPPTKPKNKHPKVIERDILGMGKEQKRINKYAGKGVIISAYDGGYGEDMDCDFDGTLDMDKKDTNSKKKKNMDFTTTADKEYGSSKK